MYRKLAPCLAALLLASPALAQSVIVSESAVQTQALSPSLGSTESLAIVSPEMAAELIEVPVVSATSEAIIATPTQVGTATVVDSTSNGEYGSFVLSDPELSTIDALPRITPAMAATLVVDTLTVDAAAQPVEDDVEVYVVGDGEILPSTAWGAQDTAACKASGGIELPLPGGRIGCFKL